MDLNAPYEEAQRAPSPRPKGSGLWAWIALGAIALVFLSYLKWRPLPLGADGVNHPAVGQRLAFLQLEPLTGGGEPVNAADLQGKVTLVNIWGTWCPPCAEEFPYLVAIYNEFRSRSEFQYFSVSYDGKTPEELRESTSDFLQQMRADHATYYDPGAATMNALQMIGIQENAFPTNIVLDTDGTIRGVWQGYDRLAIAQIEELLGQLLE
jgi:thiol-disulfide isomerase/thioredoxin